jgi:imidazolonepropionase-like amidohydrolase
MSDHPVILQEQLFSTLRYFLRLGVSKTDAVGILSRNNAEILGVNKFLGSVEKGKWASFVCWNGDPFEMSSYPVVVYAEGEKIY